jgi:hypothetical protein
VAEYRRAMGRRITFRSLRWRTVAVLGVAGLVVASSAIAAVATARHWRPHTRSVASAQHAVPSTRRPAPPRMTRTPSWSPSGQEDSQAEKPRHRPRYPSPTATPSVPVIPLPPTDERSPTGEAPTPPPPSTPTASVTPPAGDRWKPAVGTTWQWQLAGTTDLSANVGMFDLDLFDTSAATVSAVHAKGAKAVCYMETGAWESYRPDAPSYPSAVLGKAMDGYPNERYVDIRQVVTLRPLIQARLDLCKEKGFDGVEPDIDDSVVDVGASGIGFPVSYADQIAFNTMVAQEAHKRGLAIGLKNGTFGDGAARFVTDMEPLVDFAVNEECMAAGKVCPVLKTLVAKGKPVFHTEYLSDYSGSSTSSYSAALIAYCPVTKALGFSSILKDASSSLTAWRMACP